jgi:four helix bundle protein
MKIDRVDQLHVYASAFDAAMEIFGHSKGWPGEEKYALTSQVRRSSRSICANLSEAWAKRRYPDHFVSKLTDAHGEAEETLTWLRFATACDYLGLDATEQLVADYRQVIGGILRMANDPAKWCLPHKRLSSR